MANLTNGTSAARLSVDLRVWSLLIGEARRRTVTRVFGVPGDQQSFLGTVALLGAAGVVARGALPARPHLSRADAAMGGTLVNTSLRGLAGAPAQAVPLAGALIAFGVLGHAFRPMVVGAIHDIEDLAHRTRSAFTARYSR
ncbi:MAG: hypothetical protein ABI950_03875 [Solirubrobacteraceae bacterium]